MNDTFISTFATYEKAKYTPDHLHIVIYVWLRHIASLWHLYLSHPCHKVYLSYHLQAHQDSKYGDPEDNIRKVYHFCHHIISTSADL